MQHLQSVIAVRGSQKGAHHHFTSCQSSSLLSERSSSKTWAQKAAISFSSPAQVMPQLLSTSTLGRFRRSGTGENRSSALPWSHRTQPQAWNVTASKRNLPVTPEFTPSSGAQVKHGFCDWHHHEVLTVNVKYHSYQCSSVPPCIPVYFRPVLCHLWPVSYQSLPELLLFLRQLLLQIGHGTRGVSAAQSDSLILLPWAHLGLVTARRYLNIS